MKFVQQSCNKSTLEVPTMNMKLEVKRIDEFSYPTTKMCPNIVYVSWNYG